MIKLKNILIENVQLADKIYFNTGKLSKEDKNTVMGVTHGDNYTKIISDILFVLKNYYEEPTNQLIKCYTILKNYNKNVFPMVEFTNIDSVKDVPSLIYYLNIREDIIDNLKKLPSVAVRNLKSDIRLPRNVSQLSKYKNDLEYFIAHLSYLSNRNEDIKNKIIQKIFKNNTTLDDMLDFVEEKENLIGGVDITKKEIIDLVSKDSDMKLLYNKRNVLIVEVVSPQAIKKIGCTSLWCFTYGSGFDGAIRQWNSYSTNGIVYVIFDFNEKINSSDFMNVVIKPIDFSGNYSDEEGSIYDLKNEPQNSPLEYLKHTVGLNIAKSILTFK